MHGEENSELLATLVFDQLKKDEQDDHSFLKSVVKRNELISPCSAVRDRGWEEKSRILLQAVSA